MQRSVRGSLFLSHLCNMIVYPFLSLSNSWLCLFLSLLLNVWFCSFCIFLSVHFAFQYWCFMMLLCIQFHLFCICRFYFSLPLLVQVGGCFSFCSFVSIVLLHFLLLILFHDRVSTIDWHFAQFKCNFLRGVKVLVILLHVFVAFWLFSQIRNCFFLVFWVIHSSGFSLLCGYQQRNSTGDLIKAAQYWYLSFV